MNYINHINKYADAQAIQDALDAGQIANPYVAMTSAGTLDYNTLSPTPPAPATMGTWSDDGQGVYTFQILDKNWIYWENRDIIIGTLNGVYFQDALMDMDIVLYSNTGGGMWGMDLTVENLSENPSYLFEDDIVDTWNQEGVMTELGDSSAFLQVGWDGVDTFVFQRHAGGTGAALQMTTIDPPYPAGE